MATFTALLLLGLCNIILSQILPASREAHKFSATKSTIDDGIYSSYRKDNFLPYDIYPEAGIPDPIDGGRIHIVSVASIDSAQVGNLYLNNILVNLSATDNFNSFMDWFKVFPSSNIVQGDPIFISFHSRSTLFDNSTLMSVRLEDANTQAPIIQGEFYIAISPVLATYIAPINSEMYSDEINSFDSILVHIYNQDSIVHKLTEIIINGQQVPINSSIPVIPSNQTEMIEILLEEEISIGKVLTVVLKFEDLQIPIGYGTRIIRGIFPMECWPSSSDCPFPTINDTNYEFHRELSLNTFFVSNEVYCNQHDGNYVVNTLAPEFQFWTLPDVNSITIINSSRVSAAFIADEDDQNLENAPQLLQINNKYTSMYPLLPTYAGGSRNRYNGAFAGIADIQGMDMYIAACAPHVENFGYPPPPRGSYDYVKNARNNHMPLSTWTYSQGIFRGWDANIPIYGTVHRQPDPAELRIQIMSVVASGAKGLMLFQTEMSEIPFYNNSFQEMRNVNKDIESVSFYLREGDVTSMVSKNDAWDESICDMIRSRDALIVPFKGGYSDLECAIFENVHWDILPHTLDVNVSIPETFSVVDMFEVQNGEILEISPEPIVFEELRIIMFPGVKTSPELISRLYVLGANYNVRKYVQTQLSGGDF